MREWSIENEGEGFSCYEWVEFFVDFFEDKVFSDIESTITFLKFILYSEPLDENASSLSIEDVFTIRSIKALDVDSQRKCLKALYIYREKFQYENLGFEPDEQDELCEKAYYMLIGLEEDVQLEVIRELVENTYFWEMNMYRIRNLEETIEKGIDWVRRCLDGDKHYLINIRSRLKNLTKQELLGIFPDLITTN